MDADIWPCHGRFENGNLSEVARQLFTGPSPVPPPANVRGVRASSPERLVKLYETPKHRFVFDGLPQKTIFEMGRRQKAVGPAAAAAFSRGRLSFHRAFCRVGGRLSQRAVSDQSA